MAELTPEVANALVQLMNGEIDYGQVSDADLFSLARASQRGRQTLHEVVIQLRERGYTLARIGEVLGVTESAVSRWADAPPRPLGRRRQGE